MDNTVWKIKIRYVSWTQLTDKLYSSMISFIMDKTLWKLKLDYTRQFNGERKDNPSKTREH